MRPAPQPPPPPCQADLKQTLMGHAVHAHMKLKGSIGDRTHVQDVCVWLLKHLYGVPKAARERC